MSVGERRPEDIVVPLGEEPPALVHHHVRVAALHRVQLRGHRPWHAVANVPEIEVVWCAREDRPIGPRGVLRIVDVGGHAYAVAHRHHHLALDHRKRFQFVLDIPAALDLLRSEAAPLRHGGGNGDGERYQNEEERTKDRGHGQLPWDQYRSRILPERTGGRDPQPPPLVIPHRLNVDPGSGVVYMLQVMTLRSLAAALLILGTAVPYTAPMLCMTFGQGHLSQMASCPGDSVAVTGSGHTGCDLAQCATPSIAAPLTPLGISLALPIAELPRLSADNDFDGDLRPPPTPPPIA